MSDRADFNIEKQTELIKYFLELATRKNEEFSFGKNQHPNKFFNSLLEKIEESKKSNSEYKSKLDLINLRNTAIVSLRETYLKIGGPENYALEDAKSFAEKELKLVLIEGIQLDGFWKILSRTKKDCGVLTVYRDQLKIGGPTILQQQI